MIEIPINYEKGEESSNESSTCYDPDGKASTTENLFISSEYVGSGSKKYSKDELEKEIEKGMDGNKLELEEVKSHIKGVQLYKLKVTLTGDLAGVAEEGYIVYGKSRVLLVFVAGENSVSDARRNMLDHSMKTLMTYN